MSKKFLLLAPEDAPVGVLKSLAAPTRLAILSLLHEKGPMNVNDISNLLEQPQSSTSSHINSLESADLITTESQKGRKGSQKICRTTHEEIALPFSNTKQNKNNVIEVAIPVGLYSEFDIMPLWFMF